MSRLLDHTKVKFEYFAIRHTVFNLSIRAIPFLYFKYQNAYVNYLTHNGNVFSMVNNNNFILERNNRLYNMDNTDIKTIEVLSVHKLENYKIQIELSGLLRE